MSYRRKTWQDRNSQYPYRRLLTDITGTNPPVTVDVSRAEGDVTTEGDPYSANNMNDLEGRIANQFTALENMIPDTASDIDYDNTGSGMSATNVQDALDELAAGGGGGGASTLAALTDTRISNPSNGQVLTYNANNSKWENANPSGSGTAKQIIITCDLSEETLDSSVDQDGNTIAIASLYNYAKTGANIILIDSSAISMTSLNEKQQFFLSHIDGYTNAEDDSEHIKYFFTTFAFSGTVFTAYIDYNITDEVFEIGHQVVTSSAPLHSPALTGTPTAPTPTAGDDTGKIATTAFVQAAIDAMSYHAGDTINLNDNMFAGTIYSDKKSLYFFIPVNRPLGSDISTITLSGNWVIRHADGLNLLSSASLASVGDVTTYKRELGISVRLVLNTATSAAGLSVITAYSLTGRVTFS